MGDLLNNPENRDKRRVLRRNAPLAEVLLWQRLRDRQLGGFKFRRQYGIGPYIADFCCVEARLVIELDGVSHEESAQYDGKRQAYFQTLGIQVIRFQNAQIYHEMDCVLENLLAWCEAKGEQQAIP